jgi:predicted ATPase/DNA-binding SARP family transcriptional activator/uncharacterized protein HemY
MEKQTAEPLGNPTEAGLTLRFLGNFGVWVGQEPLPKLRSRQGVRLLALLALRASRTVERAYLAETLWPKNTTDAGLALLRRSLTDLRGALGTESPRLQSPTKHTLRLDLSQGVFFDCVVFESASQSEDYDTLDHAVSLYRGAFLEDFREEWVHTERARLQEIFLSISIRLAVHPETPREKSILLLRRGILIEPLREEVYRSLMERQALIGDTNGVTATFQQLTKHLKRELDRVPDEQTYLLYRKFLREGRERLLRKPERRVPTAASSLLNLPLPVAPVSGPFFGRNHEKENLTHLLINPVVRLVTVTGLGGSGKTRLCLEVAQSVQRHFPGGVWFVPLADCRSVRQVAEVLAKTLNLPLEAETPLLERLVKRLTNHQKPCLLVLDNAEHLLSPDTKQDSDTEASLTSVIQSLLRASSPLTIFTTSRQALRLPGEQEMPLAPLLESDSLALFVNRVQAVRRDLPLNKKNKAQLAALSQRLEGIPLALEMVAVWLHTLPLDQILQRLEQRLDTLVDERSDTPLRHQSMRAVLSWSYDILPPSAQRLFASLAVFSGSWDVDAASALSGTDAQALLPLLEEHALIFQTTELGDTPRYRLLEVVREFAMEQLTLEGKVVSTYEKHVTYFSARAAAAYEGILTAEQAYWHAQMDRDKDNIYAALDYLAESHNAENVERFLALTASLSRFWERRGYFTEAYLRCQQGISLHANRPPTPLSARAVLRMGLHHMRRGERDKARTCCEQAIAFFTQHNDPASVGDAHQTLGNLCADEGNHTTSLQHFEQGLAHMRRANDPNRIASLLGNLGSHYRHVQLLAKALPYYQEQLTLRRQLGDHGRVARSLGHLGSLYCHLGDFMAARAYLQESSALHQKFQNDQGMADNYYYLGQVAYAEGNFTESEQYFRDGLHLNRKMDLTIRISGDLAQLARVAEAKQDFLRAFRLSIVAEGLQNSPTRDMPVQEFSIIEGEINRLKSLCLEKCGVGATHKVETDAYLLPISEHLDYALAFTETQDREA